MSTQQSKRFVTMRQYIQLQIHRMGLGLFGVFLLLVTTGLTLSLIVPMICFVGGICNMNEFPDWKRHFMDQAIISAVVLLVMVILILGLGHWAHITLQRACKIDVGVPMTRANMGCLPAAESLLRGTDLPVSHHQQLLRAAVYGQETPSEELLRATPNTVPGIDNPLFRSD